MAGLRTGYLVVQTDASPTSLILLYLTAIWIRAVLEVLECGHVLVDSPALLDLIQT